jgi:acetyltransferase
VFDAAIRRAGMLRVDTLQELFMAAETLARFGSNRDTALTMMTNGGGAGVMAADAAALAGVHWRTQAARAPGSTPSAADLVARQPDRHHRRCAGAALHRHAAGAARRPDRPARAVHARADRHRAQRRHRAACVPLARQATSRDVVLAGRRAVAEARHLFEAAGIADYGPPKKQCAPSPAGDLPPQPGPAARSADSQRDGAAEDRPPAGIIAAALAEGRDMLDERGQGAAEGLRHRGGADAGHGRQRREAVAAARASATRSR